MKLLINCSNLIVGGGIQVAHSFIHFLMDREDKNDYIVICSKELLEQINFTKNKRGNKIAFDCFNVTAAPLGLLCGRNHYLDAKVAKHKVDVVFTVFGPTYWKPKVPHVCGFARPNMIYRDSPFFSELNLLQRLKQWLKISLHKKSFERFSDELISENSDVSDKLKVLLSNKKIHTVSNYFNQVFEDSNQWSTTSLSEFDGLTLLTISSNYPHKNLSIIPNVVDELVNINPDFKFRFVLTTTQDQFELSEQQKNFIVFLGKVSISQCPELYTKSDVMFLPTLLECFSASYAEAMYMKRPIMTSDLGFAHGICKDAAIYFDPLNPRDIAVKILEYNYYPSLKETLIKKGLERLKTFQSNQERGNKYVDICESLRQRRYM